MQNGERESHDTRKSRIYQYTNKSYEQKKKVTIHKIIEGTFSLNSVDQVYHNNTEVEQTYVKRLKHGNKIDDTQVYYPASCMSDNYDVFTDNEVTDTLKELKRETAAGIDKICKT